MEKKPVVKVVGHPDTKTSWVLNKALPIGTALFTADQLKAEREKAIREAANIAYGFHDCDAIAEEILALLSNEEKPE